MTPEQIANYEKLLTIHRIFQKLDIKGILPPCITEYCTTTDFFRFELNHTKSISTLDYKITVHRSKDTNCIIYQNISTGEINTIPINKKISSPYKTNMNYIQLYKKFQDLRSTGRLPNNVRFDTYTADRVFLCKIDGKCYFSNEYCFGFTEDIIHIFNKEGKTYIGHIKLKPKNMKTSEELYNIFAKLDIEGKLPKNITTYGQSHGVFYFYISGAKKISTEDYSIDVVTANDNIWITYTNSEGKMTTIPLKVKMSQEAIESINLYKTVEQHYDKILNCMGNTYELTNDVFTGVYEIGTQKPLLKGTGKVFKFGALSFEFYALGVDYAGNLYYKGELFAKPIDTQKEQEKQKALERIETIKKELEELQKLVK